MRLQKLTLALLILAVSAVSGWQYALVKDFPKANAISDIIPSPDNKHYATVIHYQVRYPFRPIKSYVAIEVGTGQFDQQPTIVHFNKIPMQEVDLESLGQRTVSSLVQWQQNSQSVLIDVGGKHPIKLDLTPATPKQP